MDPDAPRRRPNSRPRTLSTVLPRAATDILRRRGFAQTAIVTRWPEIVGPRLAAECAPERLVFARDESRGATLHIRTAGALALELQHLAPVVIERINVFFGFGAVARIALSQGPLPKSALPKRRARPAPPRPLEPQETQALEAAVAPARDPDLRQALANLGRTVMGSPK